MTTLSPQEVDRRIQEASLDNLARGAIARLRKLVELRELPPKSPDALEDLGLARRYLDEILRRVG